MSDGWVIFAAIAQAVSAVGTLAAVAVSLWLALRQSRPRLRLSAGAYVGPDGRPTYSVHVANVGTMPVQIRALGFDVGPSRDRSATVGLILPNTDRRVRLAHGDTHEIHILEEMIATTFEEMMARARPEARKRPYLKVMCRISTGTEVLAPPPARLYEALLARVRGGESPGK